MKCKLKLPGTRDESLTNYIFKERFACFQRKQERRDRLAAFQRKREWELTRVAYRHGRFCKDGFKEKKLSGLFFQIMPLAWHTCRDLTFKESTATVVIYFFVFFKNYLRGFLALRHPLYAIDKLSLTLNSCILDLQKRRMAFRLPPPSPFILILAKVYPSAILRRAN